MLAMRPGHKEGMTIIVHAVGDVADKAQVLNVTRAAIDASLLRKSDDTTPTDAATHVIAKTKNKPAILAMRAPVKDNIDLVVIRDLMRLQLKVFLSGTT